MEQKEYYNRIQNNAKIMSIFKEHDIADVLMAAYVEDGIDNFHEFMNSIGYKIEYVGERKTPKTPTTCFDEYENDHPDNYEDVAGLSRVY
jgi:hypothetical protein